MEDFKHTKKIQLDANALSDSEIEFDSRLHNIKADKNIRQKYIDSLVEKMLLKVKFDYLDRPDSIKFSDQATYFEISDAGQNELKMERIPFNVGERSKDERIVLLSKIIILLWYLISINIIERKCLHWQNMSIGNNTNYHNKNFTEKVFGASVTIINKIPQISPEDSLYGWSISVKNYLKTKSKINDLLHYYITSYKRKNSSGEIIEFGGYQMNLLTRLTGQV